MLRVGGVDDEEVKVCNAGIKGTARELPAVPSMVGFVLLMPSASYLGGSWRYLSHMNDVRVREAPPSLPGLMLRFCYR